MPRFETLTGNQSLAWGARLCRPQVVAAYPITPQSEVAETLSKWVANGELNAEYINVEGEYSVGGAIMGASDAGARVFTATNSEGLLFGYEYFVQIGWYRLPVVMAVPNRSPGGFIIFTDHRDSLTLKSQNWIQFYCEDHQEALDTLIQSYRVAEDPRVSMPVMVCIDGFYLSHTTSTVEIPDQELVDEFLPPLTRSKPQMMPPMTPEEETAMIIPRWSYNRLKAQINERVKPIIEEVDREFGEKFGRSYGGLIEAYRCDDADMAIVGMGSMTGTAKDVIDEYRDKGLPVGLIKLRVFRPFPTERIRELAENIKVMVAMDRNTAYGAPGGGGAIFEDLKSALYHTDEQPRLLDFVVGLTGIDITEVDFRYAINQGLKVLETGEIERETDWLYWGQPYDVQTVAPVSLKPSSFDPRYKGRASIPGDLCCPGCTYPIAIRHFMDNLEKLIVLVAVVGCPEPRVVGPATYALFPGGSCYASGVSRALKTMGKKEGVEVIYCGGDGGIADVGFQALSGAAERNEDITVICMDNEAYMNTGIQRSGTTPLHAWTTTTEVGKTQAGKTENKKDMPLIMAAHNIPYVATVSVSHIKDLIRKAKRISKIKGFRYIHILAPCTAGWRFPEDKGVELARLAVQTGYFPLFEIENGNVFRFTVKPRAKPRPVIDFLKLQGRFRHLKETEVQEIQNWVDARLQYYKHLEKIGEELAAEL